MAQNSDDDIERVAGELRKNLEFKMAEHRDFREQMVRADQHRTDTHGRFMILGAAIVGLMVPLSAGRLTQFGVSRVNLAVVMFLAAIALSAAASVPLRLLGNRVRHRFTTQVDASALWRAAYILSVAHSAPSPTKTEAEAEQKAFIALQQSTNQRELFRIAEDAAFYGLLVAGLWNVAVAFLYGLQK